MVTVKWYDQQDKTIRSRTGRSTRWRRNPAKRYCKSSWTLSRQERTFLYTSSEVGDDKYRRTVSGCEKSSSLLCVTSTSSCLCPIWSSSMGQFSVPISFHFSNNWCRFSGSLLLLLYIWSNCVTRSWATEGIPKVVNSFFVTYMSSLAALYNALNVFSHSANQGHGCEEYYLLQMTK